MSVFSPYSDRKFLSLPADTFRKLMSISSKTNYFFFCKKISGRLHIDIPPIKICLPTFASLFHSSMPKSQQFINVN